MRKIMKNYHLVDRWDLTSINFSANYQLHYEICIPVKTGPLTPDEDYHPNANTIGSFQMNEEEVKHILIRFLYESHYESVDITDGNGWTFLLDHRTDFDNAILSKRLGIMETLIYSQK